MIREPVFAVTPGWWRKMRLFGPRDTKSENFWLCPMGDESPGPLLCLKSNMIVRYKSE